MVSLSAGSLAGAGCARTNHTSDGHDEQHLAAANSGSRESAVPAASASNPADDHHHHAGVIQREHDHSHDHLSLHPARDPEASCACAAAMHHHGWCRRCNVGYLAGQRVESALLFETLDPHGHDLDAASLTCPTCQTSMRHGGYCDACGLGFVAGKAYFTRLTFGVARGKTVERDRLACSACRQAAAGSPWCDHCARGMIGNVSISDPVVHQRTAAEFAVLRAAIDKAKACELCACAMVVHRTCPNCLISYP